MSKFATVLKAIGAIGGVVLVGILVGWWAGRGGEPKPTPSLATADLPKPANANHLQPIPHPAASRPAEVISNSSPAQATAVATNLLTDWENKLDQILGGPGDESDKAKLLVDMFPWLPENGQVEVARHLSNLTTDNNYATLGQFLTNSTLPAPVLDVLMQDLLNRPNSVKLPMFVGIARQEQNPESGEARELLELFLENNYGNDWNKWSEKVQQWLQDNPD
jgi:hypothetical protein